MAAPPPIQRGLNNDVFEDVITDEEDDNSSPGSPKSPKEKDESEKDNEKEQNHVTPTKSQDSEDTIESKHEVIVTNPSVDMFGLPPEIPHNPELEMLSEEKTLDTLDCLELHGNISPASSNGGVYSVKILNK